jgi:hypothetical protein
VEIFDPKDPSEVIPLTYDFRPEMDGQTIVSLTVVVTVFKGFDADPSTILQGPALASGYRVRQVVIGGVDGVWYLIRITATTDTGLKYTLGRVLPIAKAGTY